MGKDEKIDEGWIYAGPQRVIYTSAGLGLTLKRNLSVLGNIKEGDIIEFKIRNTGVNIPSKKHKDLIAAEEKIEVQNEQSIPQEQ